MSNWKLWKVVVLMVFWSLCRSWTQRGMVKRTMLWLLPMTTKPRRNQMRKMMMNTMRRWRSELSSSQ